MDTMAQRAEEFAQTGVTKFKRWELKAWFEAERLGKNVWRNLDEHLKARVPGATIDVFELDNEYIMVNHSHLNKLVDWT